MNTKRLIVLGCTWVLFQGCGGDVTEGLTAESMGGSTNNTSGTAAPSTGTTNSENGDGSVPAVPGSGMGNST